MATQIQLGENQIQDFQVLRDLGTEALASVAQHLGGLDPGLLNPAELFAVLKRHLEGDERAAECVMRQALSLNGLMRKTGMEVDAVLAAVRSGIERNAQWTLGEIEKWNAVEPTPHSI